MATGVSRAVTLVVALLALAAGSAFAASPSSQEGPAQVGSHFVPHLKAPSVEARAALDAVLFQYDVVELPLGAVARQVRTRGELALVLQSRLFEMDLELNDLRAPGFQTVLMTAQGAVEVPSPAVVTYRGTLRGEPDSIVRVTADRGMFTGMIKSGDDFLFIDPLRDYVANAPMHALVVYREADIRPEGGGLCGVGGALSAVPGLGAEAGPSLAGPGVIARGHTTLRRLQVATDADGEYYQRFGNPGTFDRIKGILNNVDGIYRNQLNLYISITYMQAWTNPSTDPYSSNDAVTNLNQFRNWWNANRTGTVRDAAHLWSGKTFNNGVIGVAWVGVICNSPSYSYGLSQDLSNSGQRTRLTAHEIGHNLSAQHDNQIGCPGVSCNGSGPIMCSSIQPSGPNSFSSCSVSAVNNHTHNNGSCLN
ncbi:MAG TPA: M12 family metallo-peptidase [Thermoanaerobaculia bacterium]|nr:M12 family metallo-peptidase [Thermoanaerobaculia bacterium]